VTYIDSTPFSSQNLQLIFLAVNRNKKQKITMYTVLLPLDEHTALCIAKFHFCSYLFSAVIQFLEIIFRYVINNLELATGVPEEKFHIPPSQQQELKLKDF
jgi:hypothetical protein